jgi:hypothetical protein
MKLGPSDSQASVGRITLIQPSTGKRWCTSSNLRLLPWLDIGIVSTLPHFLHIVLQVVSTPWVVYLSGYHTLSNSFWVPPHIPTYDIQCSRMAGCTGAGRERILQCHDARDRASQELLTTCANR